MIYNFFRRDTLHKPFLFFVFLFFSSALYAQFFPAPDYPRDAFIYPVVVSRISLAANFGELRPNHYHMGLDCRTDHVQNKIVKAAAAGYIARVSIQPFGFGRAIYIAHPNGLTTVYGHLNDFYPALEKYVKEKQYQLESWQVSLDIPAGLFPVKQGQFIAYSGTTGGSQGPHTHFEIRDTRTGKVLNPLLFNLPIPDRVPPSIVRLYLYDREKSTYSQVPRHLPIKKTGNRYTTVQKVIPVPTDKVSFGISANDKQSGSANPNGIYEAIIYLDGAALSAFRIDSITYDESRYVNAHIDYRTRAAGGPYIEHLSRLPGYPEGVYKDILGDGVITLQDTRVHKVRIVVKDCKDNTSVLEFEIQKDPEAQLVPPDDSASYYLQKEFHPGFVNVFESSDLEVYVPPGTLYDSVVYTPSARTSVEPGSYSRIHSVLSGLVPAQDPFTVRIMAAKPVPGNLKDKILMKQTWRGSSSVEKATRNGDWYSARFRVFGDFELIADDTPPVIHAGFRDGANLSHARSIIITPRDNHGVIRNFRAELDGKWLRFTNDKGRLYIYHFDEMCPAGKHELKISAEDAAGNQAERIFTFTR